MKELDDLKIYAESAKAQIDRMVSAAQGLVKEGEPKTRAATRLYIRPLSCLTL